MAIRFTPCLRHRRASVCSEPSQSRRGSCGKTVAVSTSLPVASTTATFTPVRMPGSRPITTRGPAGAASSRSRRLSANTLIATFSASSRRRANRSRSMDSDSFTRQVQATHLRSRSSAGAACVAPAQVQRDLAFGDRGLARLGLDRQRQLGVQDLQRAAAEHGQRAVRGHAADRLVVVEVVAELGDVGVVLVLARRQLDCGAGLRPTATRAALHQRGVFGPALGQDVAHAVEHGRHGGEVLAALALLRLDEGLGLGGGIQRADRRTACRPAARCRLRARSGPWCGACGLYGRYRSSSSCLVGAASIAARSSGVSLPCSLDALEHRLAPVLEFAQVAQPRLAARAAGCRRGRRWLPCGSGR